MARSALVASDGFVSVGGPAKADPSDVDDLEDDYVVSEFCNRAYAEKTPPYVDVNVLRSWGNAETGFVSEVVHGFSSRGVDVIAFIDETVRTCTTPYTVGDMQHSILSTVELGVLAGVEASLGVCERNQLTGRNPFIFCQAYLAHGHLVVALGVRAGPSLSGNETTLRRFARIAAAALAKT